MDLLDIYQKTTWPEVPGIINHNNDEIERMFNLIYDVSRGIIVPVTTTGRVKGGWGEFVHLVTDNLTVKNQYTNLYDNNTTADYNWYTMIVDTATILRDPCTATTYWPFENYIGYKIVDVNKPYYKITNEYPVILNNANLSQVVGIYFDSSLIGALPFQILLDPCAGTTYTVDTSYAGIAYVELVATAYDPSWGSTWEQYKYAIDGAGGTQSSISIVGFLKESSIGSDFYWSTGYLEVSTSIAGVSQNYVDGSLSKIRATYIPNSSLSSDFVWSGGGLTVNTTLTGVSKAYVDGSLSVVDARLDAIEVSINYILDISVALSNFISDSSLSSDFYWDNGLLEVSTGFGGVTQEYVDGSLAARDASLSLYVLKTGDTISGPLLINSSLFVQNETMLQNTLSIPTADILTDDISLNTRLGLYTLLVNSTGQNNTAIGYATMMSNMGGNSNTAIGYNALGENISGEENIAVGYQAGTYTQDVTTGDNTSSSKSIFIGVGTKPLEENDDNEIVIGHEAEGKGSNTIVLGNDMCVSTYLHGALYIVKDVTDGGLSPKTTETNLVYYNTTTGELTHNEHVDVSTLTSSSSFIYMGNESIDGSWRFRIDSSGNLSVEKRVAGSWTIKGNFI